MTFSSNGGFSSSAGGSVQAQLDVARGPLTRSTKKENVVEHLATSSPILRSKLVELEKQEAAVAEQIETKTHASPSLQLSPKL